MYLFFDTETTGIPLNYKAPVSDLKNWPRLVEIGWILTDESANEIEAHTYIIRPEGFIIPQDSTEIHGITTEKAMLEGVDLKVALSTFESTVRKADLLIAHNMAFDEKIVGAELIRIGLTNILDTKKRACTMSSSTDFCELPNQYGYANYKWPKLEELHRILFGSSFKESHRAMTDVRACMACFFELKRLGIIG